MLKLEVKYRNKTYNKSIPEEEDNPLYSDAVSREVSKRLKNIELNDNIVDTQEVAIMANLLAEHEFCKNRDLYKKTIYEAEKKISELNSILDSVLA